MIRLSVIIFVILSLFTTGVFAQTSHIKGVVLDDKKNPIAYANIYIDGTIDGTSSEEDGSFDLETNAKGIVTLKASFVGYKLYSITEDISKLNNLTIVLKEDLTNLKEVVVSAGNYQLKGTNMEKTNAVELVTTAGSEGDLYKSIALLPGMQIGGTDGKLQVRGGSSHESQTYIDEMHVMKAYTSMPANTTSRSVFSPFIFETINFSMGGYSSEYSQSLSSVLPLYTKDESPITKTGLSLMSAGLGTGGTKAWDKGSTSFEVNYTNMAPYSKLLFPSEKPEWDKYYQALQASNQIRLELGDKTYLKTFFSYNKTTFKKKETGLFDDIQRKMDFDEDNLYLNSTFNKKFKSGFNYFAGAAFSWNRQDIKNARILNDAFKSNETELHLKTKASKRYSSLYKLGVGMESLIKGYEITYKSDDNINRKVNHSINGLFVTNDFNLTYNLLLNVSSRLEYTTLDKSWAVLPRIALNYNLKNTTLSGAIGKYQQTTIT
ncbi:MAG: carboxypeptidase-like regulatory domain-containing protein [Dysgonomonas sp.]